MMELEYILPILSRIGYLLKATLLCRDLHITLTSIQWSIFGFPPKKELILSPKIFSSSWERKTRSGCWEEKLLGPGTGFHALE